MESYNKIFVGYLMPFVMGITYFAIKEEVIMLLMFGVLGCLSFSLVAIGMVELMGSKDKKVAAKLKDGDYYIKSSPIIETRKGISSHTYFEDISEFDLQNAMNAMLDVAKSVHLFLEPAYYGQPMRNYVIPAEKIPARLWPLIFPGHIIKVRNGFVRDICKPGDL